MKVHYSASLPLCMLDIFQNKTKSSFKKDRYLRLFDMNMNRDQGMARSIFVCSEKDGAEKENLMMWRRRENRRGKVFE